MYKLVSLTKSKIQTLSGESDKFFSQLIKKVADGVNEI